MDFDLSEEQQQLTDGLDRLLQNEYSFEQRLAIVREQRACSPAMWARFAELGLLALPFADSDGGLGGGPVDTLLVAELLGRHLVVEPYLANTVLAGSCLRQATASPAREHAIQQLLAGERRFAVAHAERGGVYDPQRVTTTATVASGQWTLNGSKAFVLGGAAADTLIVSARLTAGATDSLGLFLVNADTPGVSRRDYPTQDGTRVSDVELRNVRVAESPQLQFADGAAAAIERMHDEMTAALCAEAMGAMARVHELTVDYLKQRKQFGVAIGSFQALQHRAVDMLVHIEQARSIVYYATMMLTSANTDERSRAVSAAKYLVGQAGKFVGEQAIQLHGGIGMTEECQAGHYYRRLTMLEILFGDRHHHLRRLAAAGGVPA